MAIYTVYFTPSLDILPSINETSAFYSPMSVIQISPDGNIVRKNTDVSSVNKVTKNNTRVLVFYNEIRNSSSFQSLLSGPCDYVLFQRDKNSYWNAVGPTNPNQIVSISIDDNFLLFGNIEDKSLLSLVEKHHQIYPELKILAIKVTSDNAFIYEGDLDAVSSWIESNPKAAVVLEKKEDWIISKKIEIYNVDNYCVDHPVQIFPLTPKLSIDQLSEIIKNVKLETKLDETEIMELIHYAYRFRGVSNNILSVKDVGAMEVEIKHGNYNGSIFKFKKVNNQWRIGDYYEYIY